MENVQKLVSNIVRLWNEQKFRENLYKKAMSMEDVGSLRRTFSNGYISALLFKKELQGLYDHTKCNLNDGEIHHSVQMEDLSSPIFAVSDKYAVAGQIEEYEGHIIKMYKNLLSKRNLSDEANYVFEDHLKKLRDICENLQRELQKAYRNERVMHQELV